MNRQSNPPKIAQALAPGQLIGGGHRIESFLGKGGFGITYKAIDPSGQSVAIKEYFPDGAVQRAPSGTELAVVPQRKSDFDAGYRYFWDEAETLRLLKPHPNIVGVKHLFEKNNTIYMVMDFISGTPLSQQLTDGKVYNTPELTNLMGEVTMALGHLHDAEVLHLDIKPQNIMIRKSNGVPVLIDFGAARNFTQAEDHIEILTEGYAPIEMFDPSLGTRGPWSDIYSLGVVGYIAATGRKPPSAIQRVKTIRQEGRDPLIPCLQQKRSQISNNLAQVIDACLNLVPGKRPLSAEELGSLLRSGQRRRAVTRRYGSPSQVSMEQITRSVKILHVIKVTPPQRSETYAAPPRSAQPVQQVPSGPRPRQASGRDPFEDATPRKSGVDVTLIVLSIIAICLIAVICYALIEFI